MVLASGLGVSPGLGLDLATGADHMRMNAHVVNTSTPELSRRVITARTVNEELRILEAKCAKAKRRLNAMPDSKARQEVLAHHMRNLDLAIAAALAGKTYRHR